jgi:hypothetical protein
MHAAFRFESARTSCIFQRQEGITVVEEGGAEGGDGWGVEETAGEKASRAPQRRKGKKKGK